MSRTAKWIWTLIIGVPLLVLAILGLIDNAKLFLLAFMNGLTLAALYFLVDRKSVV